jgi:hypothetical protein
MNNQCKFSVVIGIGLALSPWTIFAQSPAAAPAPETATAAAIPPDQQPTKEQLIKLFEVMRVREQMQSMMKILPAMMQQQMQAQMKSLAPNLPGGDARTPEQQAVTAKMMSTYMDKILSAYSINDMMDDMAAVYQRHLSRTDVDAFIVFYQSPAGQHLLEQQPIIMQEAMPLMMSRMQKAVNEIAAEIVKEKLESLKPETPAKDKPAQK